MKATRRHPPVVRRTPSRPDSFTRLCGDLPPVVYFIRVDDGLIKIGHTAHLADRKAVHGRGWERLLAIEPGTRDDEAALHRRFASHLARGREYFNPAPELMEYVNNVRVQLGVQPLAA